MVHIGYDSFPPRESPDGYPPSFSFRCNFLLFLCGRSRFKHQHLSYLSCTHAKCSKLDLQKPLIMQHMHLSGWFSLPLSSVAHQRPSWVFRCERSIDSPKFSLVFCPFPLMVFFPLPRCAHKLVKLTPQPRESLTTTPQTNIIFTRKPNGCSKEDQDKPVSTDKDRA